MMCFAVSKAENFKFRQDFGARVPGEQVIIGVWERRTVVC